MNQASPLPSPDVATQDIIVGCAHVGLHVRVTQLTRWAEYGLMPRPHKRGLGRGKGSEQRWEADCLPRAIIIARALQASDPSLLRAARALVDAGYTIKPELMPLLPPSKDGPLHRVRFHIDSDVNDILTKAAAERGYTKKRFVEEILHTWTEHHAQTGEDLWGVLPDQK